MSHFGRRNRRADDTRCSPDRWLPGVTPDTRAVSGAPPARTALIIRAGSLACAADAALSALQCLLAGLDGEERAEALAVIAHQAPAALRVVMPHYGRFGVAP